MCGKGAVNKGISRKWCRLFKGGTTNMHDEERVGCAYQFKWEGFEHPSYSSELAPRAFHLFVHLKSLLAGHSMGSDQDTKIRRAGVAERLGGDLFFFFFDEDI